MITKSRVCVRLNISCVANYLVSSISNSKDADNADCCCCCWPKHSTLAGTIQVCEGEVWDGGHCGQIVPILLNRCQYHRLSVNYKHSNYCKTEMVYQIYKYTFHKTTNDLTGFLLWCDFIDALYQHNCNKHPLEKREQSSQSVYQSG